ncbi:MAG TPA: hypothetical protein VHR66_20225 [Gemmataceae bacterium]|jgi:hypothetical protein|nr:hypothetical protein [Gemmataceae bacterium]
MSPTLLATVLMLSPGQPAPIPINPPPLIEPATIVNFVIPTPCGTIPFLYPLVPAPVVLAHPNWYPYPGPAWWYANNVSPYHPVVHAAPKAPSTIPVVPPKR